MDTTCKWMTVGKMLLVFIGLVSLVGCVHVLEYLGSVIIAITVARLFYVGICKHYSDHFAHR